MARTLEWEYFSDHRMVRPKGGAKKRPGGGGAVPNVGGVRNSFSSFMGIFSNSPIFRGEGGTFKSRGLGVDRVIPVWSSKDVLLPW